MNGAIVFDTAIKIYCNFLQPHSFPIIYARSDFSPATFFWRNNTCWIFENPEPPGLYHWFIQARSDFFHPWTQIFRFTTKSNKIFRFTSKFNNIFGFTTKSNKSRNIFWSLHIDLQVHSFSSIELCQATSPVKQILGCSTNLSVWQIFQRQRQDQHSQYHFDHLHIWSSLFFKRKTSRDCLVYPADVNLQN